MRKYVAEFRVENVEAREQEIEQTSDIVEKGKKLDTKAIGKGISTGVALSVVGSRLYAQYKGASNSIVGDTVAQRRLDNTMAYLNEGLSLLGSIGIASLINPATAGAVAVGQVVNYSLRAYSLGQENRIKQASWEVERIVNQQMQSRLVKDITGIRI